MAVPVTDKLAKVGESTEQKVCVADPVGATGVGFTTTVTFSLKVLSHPVTV